RDGYQVNHLFELTDFVDKKYDSFKKYMVRNYVIIAIISLILASLFIVATYPLAISIGFEKVIYHSSSSVYIDAGFPFDWLQLNYLKISDSWVIEEVLITNVSSLMLDFIIYVAGILLLLIGLIKMVTISPRGCGLSGVRTRCSTAVAPAASRLRASATIPCGRTKVQKKMCP
ncbi:MAG: hypothetical protein R6X33_11835, partial [Candidatus Brocadiia bacterium]